LGATLGILAARSRNSQHHHRHGRSQDEEGDQGALPATVNGVQVVGRLGAARRVQTLSFRSVDETNRLRTLRVPSAACILHSAGVNVHGYF
jgi:hypothetical protein